MQKTIDEKQGDILTPTMTRSVKLTFKDFLEEVLNIVLIHALHCEIIIFIIHNYIYHCQISVLFSI